MEEYLVISNYIPKILFDNIVLTILQEHFLVTHIQ